MGSKGTKDLTNEDYQECCEAIKDFLSGQEKELKIENATNEVMKKFNPKEKKAIILGFIKTLVEKEKSEKILKNMEEIFIKLFEQYEQIHTQEEGSKKFSENAEENEKYIINAIYISKIFEDDIDEDAKIHDYAVYLYGESAVNEIEEGNNENIDENFKKYKEDKLDPTEEEIYEKFKEICKEKGIDPEKYDKPESISSQNDGDYSEIKNKRNLNSQKDDKSSKKKIKTKKNLIMMKI